MERVERDGAVSVLAFVLLVGRELGADLPSSLAWELSVATIGGTLATETLSGAGAGAGTCARVGVFGRVGACGSFAGDGSDELSEELSDELLDEPLEELLEDDERLVGVGDRSCAGWAVGAVAEVYM